MNLETIKNEKEDFKPMSLEIYFEMINESIRQHQNGKVLTEEEADKLFNSWQ
jgi:hypothetical protein